ncbi:cyclic GMP-AMP synthase-like receptor isoform X1 [Ornithodoros turicata]|uniref:cyclic GMP-AMP synthase-like receptor isoform X1 n=1 Tax=Ornithodoros turicata TaxID=34597 RepID=UPI003139955A
MMNLQRQEADAVNKSLLPVLDKAQGLVKLNPDERKRNVKILDTLLVQLCDDLRAKDALFKMLYNRCVYSGSFYEDLKIKSPNEFDINIVFVLPKKGLQCELKCLEHDRAFLGCCVDEEQWSKFNCRGTSIDTLFSELEGKHWLDMTKVRRWFQSLLARTNDFVNIEGIVQVKYSESGPAKTLRILTTSGRIDVDLVPVFEHSSRGWYNVLGTDRRVLEFMKKKYINIDEVAMCLVPKEHKTLNCPLYWRVHFPYIERQLMAGNGCLKPTIRLLKLLRDNLQWSLISSYALKTLVILRAMEESDEYWDKKRHGIVFYETIERLRQALLGPGIPYIYCSKVDLLQSCKPVTRVNYAGHLRGILHEIISQPQSLVRYFDEKSLTISPVENLHRRSLYGGCVIDTAQHVPDTSSRASTDGLVSAEDTPLLGAAEEQHKNNERECCILM